jgi:uncharacterized protein (TIRG00374 family)
MADVALVDVDQARFPSRPTAGTEREERAPPNVASKFADPRSLVSVAIAVTLLAFALSKSGIDPHKTLAAMKAAQLWLVALGFVVFYVSIPLRSWRWRILMLNAGDAAEREAIKAYPFCDTTEIFYLSWFANCIVPAKLGDIYRGYLARKCIGVSGSQTVGTVVAERLLDLMVLLPLMVVSTLVAFHHRLGHVASRMSTIFLFGVLLAGSAVAVLIVLWRFHTVITRRLPPHLAHYFGRFRDGAVHGLRRNVVGPLLLTVAAWCLEGARLLCIVAALGLFHRGDLGIAAALFLALGASVLTTLPLTPGGLAFVETFLVVGMTLLGIHDRSLAASVTALDRAISFLSLIVIGFLVYTFSAKTHDAEVLAPLHRMPPWRRLVNRPMAEQRAPNETKEAHDAEVRIVSTSTAQDCATTTARAHKPADRWFELEAITAPEVREASAAPQLRPMASETASGPALRLLNLMTVELVVSPFFSFQQIGRFQQMLSSIPTVQAIRLRSLQQGILQVRVECQRATDLLDSLSKACKPSVPFRVLSHEAHRIELVFEDEGHRDQEVTYA